MKHKHTEPTAYDVLGLSPTASQQEIQTTMRRLAISYHPDRQPKARKAAAELRFRAIVAAYERVKTPQARAQYDALLRTKLTPPTRTLKHSNDNAALKWLERCVKTIETIFWPVEKK